MRDKGGSRLYKGVTVIVEMPGVKPRRILFKAPPKKGFSDVNITDILDQIADDTIKRYPFLNHRLVELAPNYFKFIFAGYNLAVGNPSGVDTAGSKGGVDNGRPNVAVQEK